MTDIIGPDKYKQLSQLLHNFELDDLTEEDFKTVYKGLLYDKAKKQMQFEFDVAGFNQSEIISNWLDIQTSKRTKLNYKRAMTVFLQFLKEKDVHVLGVDTTVADEYMMYLLNTVQYSPSSAKVHLSSVSAFYTQLIRWNHVNKNPFRGQKRTFKKEDNGKHYIPTEHEINALIQSFLNDKNAKGSGSYKKRNAVVPTVSAILIMAYRGLRIGAFSTLEIKEGGRFTAYSKGKAIQGHINDGLAGKNLYQKLKDVGWKPNTPFSNSTTSQRHIDRRISVLFGNNKFSCHSFRHFFAVREYQVDKDIYRVKVLLHHSSIQTTERYLADQLINGLVRGA